MVAVADAQAFRRAAYNLGVEPSAVSRRVRALEDRLGTSLFERRSTGVKPTDAGEIFIKDVRGLLARLDTVVRTVKTAGSAGNGIVRIGIVGGLWSKFLRKLFIDYKAERSEVRLEIVEAGSSEHISAVASRALDIAFIFGAHTTSGTEYEPLWSEPLWSEPLYVALPKADPLSDATSLNIEALSAHMFVVSDDASGKESEGVLQRRLSRPGWYPFISRHRVGREALMLMVGLGFGAALACEAEAAIEYPGVTFIPLVGEAIPLSAVWSRANDNPALRRLLSAAQGLARAFASQTPDPSP